MNNPETPVQHTPGPWYVQDRDIKYPRPGDPYGDGLIAGMYGSMSNPEVAADARLIAAAPDLLNACEDILDFLRVSGFNTTRVKAAIEKARG